MGKLGNGKTKPNLKMSMWNVNGIRSVINKNSLKDFVSKYDPDFICINETKIDAEMYEKDRFKLKLLGYNDYWNFCKCSAGYSGVAVYSKYQPISIEEDFEEEIYSQEGRVLTLKYELFYLIVVYIPSAGTKELERLKYKTEKYWGAFQKHCEKVKNQALDEGKGVIICGDLNVAHQDDLDNYVPKKAELGAWRDKQPGFTPEERMAFRRFLSQGWVDTFRHFYPQKIQYTWWRIEHKNRERNIGRRLDYFLVNKDFLSVVQDSIILG